MEKLHTALERESVTRPFTNYFEVAPDIWGMRDIFVNIYMVQDKESGQWVLIDAGLKTSVTKIRRMAFQLFGHNRPEAILLTHGHFDHVGALQKLAEEWDVPVYAHPLELPYLTGKSSYPPPDPTVGGGLMAYMAFVFPNDPIDLGDRVRPLPEEGRVPVLKGWRYIHTPGHAPGHVSFFRDEDRVVIAGDAFVTTRQESAIAVMMQKKKISRPPAYFTYDWAQAADSVKKLLSLSPTIAATGHGLPMSGQELSEGLRHLYEDFYDKAVPSYGRYVNDPAIVNSDGVEYVPPAPVNPYINWLIAGGVAVTALLIVAALKKKKRAVSFS